MQLGVLEDEVSALSAEVTRLRLMVQRAGDSERQRQKLDAENAALKLALKEAREGVDGPRRVGCAPVHGSPLNNLGGAPVSLDVLPSMFSGADGTARLFKAIMEAYPWLVPPEVQEAQEIVRAERELQAEERRQRHARRVQRQQYELDAEREESIQERLVSQPHKQTRPAASLPGPAIVAVPAIATERHHEHGSPAAYATSVGKQGDSPLASGGASTPQHLPPTGAQQQHALYDRAATPTASEAAASEGGRVSNPPHNAGHRSSSDSSSPLQAGHLQGGPPISGHKAHAIPGSGLLLGTRPSSKKPTMNLLKKLRQGVASDSDEDVDVPQSVTPLPKDTTRGPATDDDHDF